MVATSRAHRHAAGSPWASLCPPDKRETAVPAREHRRTATAVGGAGTVGAAAAAADLAAAAATAAPERRRAPPAPPPPPARPVRSRRAAPQRLPAATGDRDGGRSGIGGSRRGDSRGMHRRPVGALQSGRRCQGRCRCRRRRGHSRRLHTRGLVWRVSNGVSFVDSSLSSAASSRRGRLRSATLRKPPTYILSTAKSTKCRML